VRGRPWVVGLSSHPGDGCAHVGAILPPVADPYIGQRVAGQFEIVDRIGSGGMGAVYRALQPEMNRHVAIKILHPKYLSRKDLVSRFRREARAMSQLSHPNTARVFLYGQLEDQACYFVMEYLEGRNLAQVVRAEGAMEPHRALEVMIQVCGALEEAHQAGIIHRDLKPENIFLTTQGGIEDYPKVLDFGLAKVTEKQMRPGSLILTGEGMVFGTPEFMSPEQAQGHSLDPRSDLYSLGVVLYELLTGKLPFDAKQALEFIHLHVSSPPIPMHERAPDRAFPMGLEEVVMCALAKRPEDRYASAGAFGEALKEVARGRLRTGAMRAYSPPSSRPPAASGPPSSHPPGADASMGPSGEGSPGHLPAQRDSDPPSPPMSPAPWIVFGVGVLLAIGGAIALTVSMLQ
jgi:eukaryotic-like serine/threonine-protein kinase